jgi:Putative zinc-finger
MMNTHPTREEDFDLYALGALEGEEKLELETHVAGCASCARRLAEARGRIALLAFSAPAVDPAPELKRRILERVHASRAEAGAVPAKVPTSQFARPREERPRVFGGWWTAILVPATLAFALASVYLWRENNQLQRALDEQRATLALQQAQIDSAQKELAVYNEEAQVRTAVWTGWISDSHCGIKGMNAAHKDCAMQCIKQMHAHWVFVETKTKKIYTIHNQNGVNPETSLGAEMKVTGWMMDDGTLQVEKVSATR